MNSHLRKIFRDLFNSQGFVDDGKYDWEILKESLPLGTPPFDYGRIYKEDSIALGKDF